MDLKTQKRISARVLKSGLTRVWFDPNRLDEIKEAITKADIRSLVKDRAIQARPKVGVSKSRAGKIKLQKRKGRRAGKGSRRGSRRARLPRKSEWINRIRSQRKMLKELRDKSMITKQTYKIMRAKSKGGYFRSRRHIQLYLEGNDLLVGEKKIKPKEKTPENANTVQEKETRKNRLQ